MDDRNEEDENQNQLDAVEDGDVNSDSDDVMEVDDVDDKNVATPDSELVDSDVNVEAAELTNSDVDLSDESDIKGDLSSEADSVPGSIHADSNQQPEDDSVVDSDEETFALEIKDAKEEDSMDDEEEKDEGLDGNSASSIVDSNLTKNTSAVENDDSVEKTNELKRADEKHHEKEDEEDVDRISSKDEAIKTEDEHTDVLHNGESVSSPTRIHDHGADTTDDAKSTALPKVQTKDEEATVKRKNSNVKEHDSVSVDVPNFIGFDSDVTNKTLQILYILQQHYQDLQNQPQIPEANDADQTAVEEDIEQPSQPADATSVHVSSPTKNEIIAEETSHEKQSDEQINKRIKKKRKFFDEFDNSEVEPSKKLKEQRDSTSSIEISSSENKENLISSEKLSVTKEDSIAASVSTSATALSSSTPNPPTRPETKGKFDITNPDFKEPFKYGWKREVVYRFISEDGQKKSADVSYFTPQGKKLRSIKQINENLPKDGSLHIKNFTFSKELIFRNRESELEVTRFTKKMEMELLTNESSEVSSDNIIDRRLGIEPISSSLSSTLGDDSIAAKKTPVVSSSKKKEAQKSKSNVKTPTPGTEGSGSGSGLKSKSSTKKSTKNAETEDETSNATPKLVMPKILLRGPNAANSNSTSKVTAVGKPSMKIKIAPPPAKQSSQKTTIKKVTPSSKSNKNSKSLKRDRNGDADTGATLAEWKTSDRSLHSKSVHGSSGCSISCPSALGTIPTLQCTACLCLYHFECCGLDASRTNHGYVCKNCRACERTKENVHPTLKTVRGSRSPKGVNYSSADDYVTLSLSSMAATGASRGNASSTKIVDGVTTWLPSCSNIRLKTGVASSMTATLNATSPEIQMPLVQGVLELDGRRYVVVPKQSVLSVSPNAGATIFENRTICEKSANADTASAVGAGTGAEPGLSQPSTLANTLLVNPSDVNNAGVVLVPMVPSSAIAYGAQNTPNASVSPRYAYLNENRANASKFSVPVENTCSAAAFAFNRTGINGVSANEWDACQTVGNRTATEYQSSFSLSNISRIYEPLLMSLKYLTVRDLLRISMTSKFLNRIASDPYLWKTVRLRNSQVHDWKGFAKTLQKYGTKRLDMRKMLCSNKPEDLNRMWEEFLEVIPSIRSLEHIDFSRTPMTVVDTVAATCPNLCVVNALYLKNGSLTLDNFAKLERLTELRLKGVGGIDLKRNDELLHFVNKDHLREISLTCIKNIDMHLLKTISGASNLVTLELGECAKLPTEFANEIAKLTKLEKLRLEKLEDLAPEYEILTVINNMEKLKSLELINIEVKDGFDEVLAQCTNLENFLIIPLYATQSATTNQLILHGIRNLSNTLKCFVWGLTIELLKVTDLFMDQWQPKGNNSNSQKKSGDSIPIRKIVDKPSADGDTAPTHVDILPVPKLERILATYLPHARVKVLKTPLQMTWRQSLAECFK